MLDDLDLTSIPDERARALIVRLLNLIEDLTADLRTAQDEIQRLRDEINRLKGEQGKPDIKPNVEPKLISSEKERKSQRPHRKGSKLQKIVVNRQEIVSLD